MNVRQRKRLIGLAAWLVGLAAVAVVVAGFSVPVQIVAYASDARADASDVTVVPTAASAETKADKSRLSLAELQKLCAMDLRKPLDGLPSRTAASGVPAKPGSSMPVRLVGTVIEPGHSMAMFQKGDGSIELCAEGQSVDDVGGVTLVTRIEHMKVTVEYAGQSRELIIPPTP